MYPTLTGILFAAFFIICFYLVYPTSFCNALCHCFCLEMSCLLHCSLPHFPFILFLTSLTCVHDSPAHLYMPQYFTQCLPVIICVVWIRASQTFLFSNLTSNENFYVTHWWIALSLNVNYTYKVQTSHYKSKSGIFVNGEIILMHTIHKRNYKVIKQWFPTFLISRPHSKTLCKRSAPAITYNWRWWHNNQQDKKHHHFTCKIHCVCILMQNKQHIC